jgi:hypothetical protein
VTAEQFELGPPLLGQRVGEAPGALERLGDPDADLPAVEPRLSRRRVDRHDTQRALACLLAPFGPDHHVDHRVHHLARTAVLVELAEEERLGAGGQLSRPPRLVEEDHLHRAGPVVDGELDDRPAVARPALADPSHLGQHHCLLPHRQFRQVRLAAAVDVAARVLGQ